MTTSDRRREEDPPLPPPRLPSYAQAPPCWALGALRHGVIAVWWLLTADCPTWGGRRPGRRDPHSL